ncbi:MAG: AAA family ATPase, partial [Burkholderiales bacterium]|nr:AAA family ATPase [Burkholderiales bacterium]
MEYRHRTLEWYVDGADFEYDVVLVTGMRWAGKKTMLSSIDFVRLDEDLYKKTYYDCATKAPNAFFLDEVPVNVYEVQRVPELLYYLEDHLDFFRDPRGKVWLSSSRRLQINKILAKTIPHRYVSYQLLPYSIYE